MWLLVIFCLMIGIIVGFHVPLLIPIFFAKYLSVAILASLDSFFGGIRAYLEADFDNVVLLSGFVSNSLLAAGLAYIGDQLGVALYIAAVFAFGVRIFQNLAIIRRSIIHRLGHRPTGIPLEH